MLVDYQGALLRNGIQLSGWTFWAQISSVVTCFCGFRPNKRWIFLELGILETIGLQNSGIFLLAILDDVDIPEIAGWPIRSRTRRLESLRLPHSSTYAERWGLDAVIITVNLGALVELAGLVVMRTWSCLIGGLWHLESVVIRSPSLGLWIVELRIRVIRSIGIHFQSVAIVTGCWNIPFLRQSWDIVEI